MVKRSMRQIANELDISPAYLSYMINGKRPWRKDLYQRYMGVVNTFVNGDEEGVNKTGGAAATGENAVGVKNAGRGGENRTPDLLLPKQAPYRWATPRMQMQSYHAWTRAKGQILSQSLKPLIAEIFSRDTVGASGLLKR